MDYIKDQVYFVLYFINIFILIKWSATVHAGVLQCFENCSNWPKFTPSGSFKRIIN